MKKIIALIIFLAPFFLNAQESNTALWEKANQLYSGEKYEEALNSYLQIANSGESSAKLYYNIGNAFYKTGDANNAILYYERAKLLAPNDEDIDFNLQVANQFVVTKTKELPQPFFHRWKNTLVNKYPVDTWAAISIVSFLLFLLLFGLFFFSKSSRTKRLSFWAAILAVIFSGITYSLASHQKKKISDHKQAIVFCPRVTVKSSPSETGTSIFLIYEGVKVNITDSLNTWTEIKLSDGNEGWLPDSCIVRI
jgi:tetratricopeptide (TPR) repeat protein